MREEQERPLQPGKITKLVAQQKNPDRVSVFLEGAFAFGVYQDLVLEFGLAVGRELSVAEQQRILAADELRVAKATALAYLAHRARTAQEVRRRLVRKGFGEEVTGRVLERLDALGYLDDAAYARDYVRGRFNNRGYGPERIRSDLMRRGVDRAHIDAALAGVLDDEAVLEAARAHARQRWARLAKEPDPRKRRKKLADFLVRRGYSFDAVWRIVEELERDAS